MDAGQLAAVLLAVGVGFFTKGVTGIGGPLLAIPVAAAFVGVEHAVAVVAVPGLMGNLWLMWEHRSEGASLARLLGVFLAVGTVGAVAGSWLLVSIDERALTLALAGSVILYIVAFLVQPELHLTDRGAQLMAPPMGLASGLLQGATGISAPPVVMYMHSIRLPKGAFVFAVSAPFMLFGAVQIVSLASLGVYDRERWIQAVIACLPLLIALPLGIRLGRRLSQVTFERMVLALLAVVAAKMIWDNI